VKSLFSADPFSQPTLGRAKLNQGAECVLIGTETHPSDLETLFQRTIDKYEGLGWTIVREETGRIFYKGSADETPEANLWACPPDTRAAAELGRPILGQVGVVGGFGGPGGFSGGPGGLVGPVAGAPSPESGSGSGPSIPCGPAGYGPTCAWPGAPTTVVQPVYPVHNLMGSGYLRKTY
jgi:hypothetical protein